MELVSLAGELLQNLAERAASYRAGQNALWYLDRALGVVEKCARWAVPPPLDQDERPQPELVRPLPWVFFLSLLIILRVTRESISLVNLIMGKPPLRSADVVTFIQGRRRYLRTLKYHGNRQMRARNSSGVAPESWARRLHALLQFTMCLRRSAPCNNNTTSVTNNHEVLVVKRSKRGRENSSPVASSSVESTMERLIEKMMVDLDADSDEDSSFTLTNVTSPKSDDSEFTVESDQDATCNDTQNDEPETPDTPKPENDTSFSPIKNGSSTPEETIQPPKDKSGLIETSESQEISTPKQESLNFIQHEILQNAQRTPKNEKIANGRTVNSVPNKMKGSQNERREADVSIARIASGNNSF